MSFACVTMDMCPILRRLPRRLVLCLYLVCASLGACALLTLYLDSRAPMVPTSTDSLSPDEQNFQQPLIKPTHSDVESISPPKWTLGSRPAGDAVPAISVINKNISLDHSLTHRKTTNGNTKYIYITSNTSTFRPTKKAATASPLPSTPAPVDTCHTFSMKSSKLILLWTPFFGNWEYFPKENLLRCARCRNCQITTDRSLLAESDAVVFHARDMSLSDLPPIRHPKQRWIFYCLESPPYSDFAGLQHMKNMFNWTMTYRMDSDIVARYGSAPKIHPPRKLNLASLRESFANKSKSCVWMSSHCPTFGGRDAFIAELKKYIDVDVYGSCGRDGVCERDNTHNCFVDFAGKYKFFLAFENTVCGDYVTEKFYRTLKYDIIPVVFGGARYESLAPPNSYVDALSFKSPKHLAFFLAGVGKDFKMYSSYFRWRTNYAVNLDSHKECDLCSLLHRTDLPSSSYPDLRQWWVRDSHCRTWKPKR